MRPLALILATFLMAACATETTEPPEPSESEQLLGQWGIADPVAPLNAQFNADGSYRIEQNFGSTPIVKEGPWALTGPSRLALTEGPERARIRTTETIHVDGAILAIGGVLIRAEPGPGLEGIWNTSRTVEQENSSGVFEISSHTQREVALQADGSGSLRATTEGRNSMVDTDIIRFTTSNGGRTVAFTEGLSGTFTLIGDRLVPTSNAYKRQ